MNWNELEIFKGVDLHDSFVLSWHLDSREFTIELDASIWPESDYYQAPVNNEFTCYLKASLKFNEFENIIGLLPISEVVANIDPDGSKDYGNIDEFLIEENGFKLQGDFGEVSIEGGIFVFKLHS